MQEKPIANGLDSAIVDSLPTMHPISKALVAQTVAAIAPPPVSAERVRKEMGGIGTHQLPELVGVLKELVNDGELIEHAPDAYEHKTLT
ncbi:MAG: hypothetical protein ABIQ16_03685 [Polyangiaceae bacterium]